MGKDADTRAWIDMMSFVRKPLDFGCTMFYHYQDHLLRFNSPRFMCRDIPLVRANYDTDGNRGPADRL